MKRLKLAFTLLILAVLSVMGFMLYSNIDLIVNDQSQESLIKQEADYSLSEPHFIEMEGNRKVLDVRAEEASYFKEAGSADLIKPRLQHLGQDKKASFLEGDRGKIDTDKGIVLLEGNVRLSTDDGYVLETQRAQYYSKEKRVHTDERVRVRGADFDMKGIGLDADIESERFRIIKDVEAVFDESRRGRAFE